MEKISLTINEYIDMFLTPGLDIPKHTTLLQIAEDVIDPPLTYDNAIETKIHTLTYDEFLQTLYWRAIAAFKRKKMRFKCEGCGSTKDLNVHHRTYIIHGVEHDSEVIEKDLMLVCAKCHSDIHNTK